MEYHRLILKDGKLMITFKNTSIKSLEINQLKQNLGNL